MLQTDSTIAASSDVGAPIRAEVFGAERLEQHAASLAAVVRVTEKPTRGRDLLPRVHDNRRALLGAYHNVVEELVTCMLFDQKFDPRYSGTIRNK